MEPLDPSHELPPGHEQLDLPPPYHRAGWSWLLALVVSTVATFALTIVLVALNMNPGFILVSVPLVFVFTLFLVHAAVDRAR